MPAMNRFGAAFVAFALFASTPARGAEYNVHLVPAHRDYALTAPAKPGDYAIHVSGAAGVAKNKLVFASPLAPGEYRLRLEADAGCANKTVVLSVPVVSGAYRFELSTRGQARFDLAFHDDGPTREHRLTLYGAVDGRQLRFVIPPRH